MDKDDKVLILCRGANRSHVRNILNVELAYLNKDSYGRYRRDL
jgi:hypothetical protein